MCKYKVQKLHHRYNKDLSNLCQLSPGMRVNTVYINFIYTLHLHACQVKVTIGDIYLAFTCMPGESYHRWLRSLLLYLCYIFQVLINSLCVDFTVESWCLPQQKPEVCPMLGEEVVCAAVSPHLYHYQYTVIYTSALLPATPTAALSLEGF